VGPADAVYALYLSDYRWRSTSSAIVALLSALTGAIALSLWMTQVDTSATGRPQRDPIYLLACLAEFSWTLSVADVIVEHPPLPWPWWGFVSLGAAGLWILCVKLFSIEVAGWGTMAHVRWLRWWFVLELMASAVAGVVAIAGGYPLALTGAYMVGGFSSLCFVLVFLWTAFRSGTLAHQVVALSFLVNLVLSLRDLYVFRLSTAYGGNTYLHYGSALFGLALAYVVVQRFRAASAQARDLAATLASRVEQKEQELAHSYQRLELLARDQERNAERSRILRDMHDGVGAHISTAIRQLQSGKSSDAELLHTLRDSLDQLKLSIDAMNQPAGDITALLANLRYRLEPRMKASDIDLHWAVDLLAPLPRLDDKAMRHLQFMVYEALSNVLQHAGATTVRIEAAQTPAGASIRLVDNGCGFDVLLPKRRGLLSMQDRANAVGAKLTLVSQPGHTVVEILIS
jgi:signal transduction histidine kinase